MFGLSREDRQLMRNTYNLVLALTRSSNLMSAEIAALRELVTKTVGDVGRKLDELIASSTSLSAEDKAAIAEMSATLTALDVQVNPPVPVETPPAETPAAA
jgi:hypothetical protein